MSNDPLNAPIPHAGDDEPPMGTVSAFTLTAYREHVEGKHPNEFETCTEVECVQARDMLKGRP